jgi:uncharacterized protein
MLKVSCPICEREMEGESTADWLEFPFCSRRCKTIDLGRWLSGRYTLPSEREDESSAPEEIS